MELKEEVLNKNEEEVREEEFLEEVALCPICGFILLREGHCMYCPVCGYGICEG